MTESTKEGVGSMIKAVIFDIGSTLVHYKNPLNWQNLYKPALEFVSEKCALNLSEKNYLDDR